MKNKILLISFFSFFLFTQSANAAIIQSGENIDIGGSTIINENVYASGGMVSIRGDIMGDINAAGGNLSLSTSSTGDIHVAGGMIDIMGKAQDVRLAGGFLNVNANVNGDLFAMGGFLQTRPETMVKGDLWIGAGTVQLNGNFKGKATINGGEVTLSGKFEGPVVINAEKVKLSSTAELVQGAKITAMEPAEIADGAKVSGEIVFEKMNKAITTSTNNQKNNALTAFAAFIGFASFLSLLVGSFIGLKLFKPGIVNRTDYALRNFWLNMFIGFASLILVPIAIIILFATIVGSFIASVAAATFILICILAKVIAVFIVGSLVWKYIFRKNDNEPSWKTLLSGTVVYYLLMIIPFIGWFVTGVFFCVGLGAMVRYVAMLLQNASPQVLSVKEN